MVSFWLPGSQRPYKEGVFGRREVELWFCSGFVLLSRWGREKKGGGEVEELAAIIPSEVVTSQSIPYLALPPLRTVSSFGLCCRHAREATRGLVRFSCLCKRELR